MSTEKETIFALRELLHETMERVEKGTLGAVTLEIGKCGELENIKIEIKRPEIVQGAPAIMPSVVMQTGTEAAEVAKKTEKPASVESRYEVTAPLIGIVYAAPSPGAEPFIHVGQKVKKGDVLCVIEAMKVMNEIESDRDGTIAEIRFTNGEMLQYGDVLVVLA